MTTRSDTAFKFFAQLEIDGLPPHTAVHRLFLPVLTDAFNETETADLLAQLTQAGYDWGDFATLLADMNSNRLVQGVTALFARLRYASTALGLEQYTPLGIPDYRLLLDALQQGLGDLNGANPRESLRRLCHLLWVKSQADRGLFDHYFDTAMRDWPLTVQPPQPVTQPLVPETKVTGEIKPTPSSEPAIAEPKLQPDIQEPTAEVAREADGRLADGRTPTGSRATFQFDLLSEAGFVAYERYLLATDYLPVTRRQLKQNWRYLRRMVRQGPRLELDVPATIQQMSRDGFLLAPVLRPRRVNRAAMILLIDQKGSMVPFHILAGHLADTVKSSGRLGQAGVYYFHNFPAVAPVYGRAHPDPQYRDHLLFQKPEGTDGRLSSLILAEFDAPQTSVLIFSDAGAARDSWNESRIHNTAYFLYQLQAHGIQEIAWLNPMPRERWEAENNSAQAIAQFVPMFSIDQQGIRQAVEVLRGRSPQRVKFA